MRLDPNTVATRSVGMREAGFWLDETVDTYFSQAIDNLPNKVAVVGYRADQTKPRHITYQELGGMVDRAAGALREMGVGRGDVVSIQLPNWWEFVVTALACVRVGAAANPLVAILREREVSYMVSFCEAKVLIVPKVFRGFDHEAMAKAIQSKVSTLQNVIVVGGEGDDNFERVMLSDEHHERYQGIAAAALKPDDLLVLMYTSGTTGEPKGVMHTSNTINGNALRFAEGLQLGRNDIFHAVSPVGHMTGYSIFVLLPILLNATVVLQDVWDAKIGLSIMEAEGVTFSAGATPFLADICETAIAESIRPSQLRRFYCAGAPIPPALVQRALHELQLSISSVWGMTEINAGTMTEIDGIAERTWTTDGRAIKGVAVKVCSDSGAELPFGEIGRLMVRSASMFCGYLKRPELDTVSADGWLDSGDLARMDAQGYIRITGRTKELLIRGGENVPVIEVENLIREHPAVANVAIVGFPDLRLGERACAFVVLRPGHTFDIDAMKRYLDNAKVSKHYWPERIELIKELPYTASGKVQRFVLKEAAKNFSVV
jgi:cyclohexanecarboxylate-CoA ligase